MFPLAFVPGSLQSHWWGFISRNYVVWPISFLMNVFIALKGIHFLLLFTACHHYITQFGQSMVRWGENGRLREKNIWQSASITWFVCHVTRTRLRPTAVRWRAIFSAWPRGHSVLMLIISSFQHDLSFQPYWHRQDKWQMRQRKQITEPMPTYCKRKSS